MESKRFAYFISVVAAFIALGSVSHFKAQEKSSIDTRLAAQYFQEQKAICEKDGGKLWGRSLCGSMLFFDSGTREVVAAQPDLEGRLTKSGDVFVGRIPESVTVANTSLTWAGVRWTMVGWNYLNKDDEYSRAMLMLHESFHSIQHQLGFSGLSASNKHLDSMEGRYWLQLEWRALRAALARDGEERRTAIADALLFRAQRRAIFPAAAREEVGLEMNEGLAEYTGDRLSGKTDSELAAYLVRRFDTVNARLPTFMRSFAYESGPAYGILLDWTKADWRQNLKKEGDMAILLQQALSVTLPPDIKSAAVTIAKRYDGDQLLASEKTREDERLKRMARYRGRFVDGPVLVLRLGTTGRFSFDPNNLVSMGDFGTVYPTMTAADSWGVLSVEGGALMSGSSNVYLPAPAEREGKVLKGDGWTLQINDGWKLEPGERKGDYLLKNISPSAAR